VRYRGPGQRRWREAELRPLDAEQGGVRWVGSFEVDAIGRWTFTIEAWKDHFGSWRDELKRKLAAEQIELEGELSEGALLLADALERSKPARDRTTIQLALQRINDATATITER
jgi:starch synthase (maltosyl-transferring)